MPAGGHDGLYLLRPLIDGLIPRQAALLTEGRHRLDEFSKMLAIAGWEMFSSPQLSI